MTETGVNFYICYRSSAEAMDFYKKAFGAEETMRQTDDQGRVRHAEIKVCGSTLMMHDEFPEFSDHRSVQAMGGSPANMFAYVDDVDAMYERSVAAGAKALGPLEDKPYGRSAGVVDPFGFTWWLCSKPA